MPEGAPHTLTDRLRKLTMRPVNRCGGALARLGIHPDWVTVAGLALVAVAAISLARGELLAGGLILLVSLPLDALDGAVARAMGRTGAFGMVLDSTLDRYADGLIFGALGYYFAAQGRLDMLALALAALAGSYLVSYVRARADDAKVAVATTVGLFTRMERVVVILIMTLGSGLLGSTLPLEIGILLLALGTNLTALQRLRHVYSTLKNRGE
ncbi:MAG: CDP-alcohol phosphatidyltransferase family protein [Anaerolineae bacterium]|nr:CDP-alcohol phosphatidyltransferase family protein [Anaerolineae bacterium]